MTQHAKTRSPLHHGRTGTFKWLHQAARLIAIAGVFTLCTGLAQVPQRVINRAFPSVVLLVMQDGHGRPVSLGSGFFVRDGIVATNLHVVRGAARGFIRLVGHTSTYAIAGVVGVDAGHDLVLLAVKGAGSPSLVIGDSHQAAIGQAVYVIGNPEGLEGTVSQGIISGVRSMHSGALLQITAPISPGSSGGPVLDGQGRVIGVASSTLMGGQNLNFAVPSVYLSALMNNMKPVKPLAIVAGTQRPQRGGHAPAPGNTFPQTEYALEHPHEVACARGTEDGRPYAETEQECQMALNSGSPDNLSMIHFAFGDLLLNEKKWDGAIAEFNASLRLSSSDDYSIHQSIGKALDGKGDLDAAIAEFRLALSLAQSQLPEEVSSGVPKTIADIELASVHTDLGVALFEKDDLDGAAAEFREVVRIKPGDAWGYDTLATVLEMNGNHAEAADQCRIARELTPSSEPISDLCRRVLDQPKP